MTANPLRALPLILALSACGPQPGETVCTEYLADLGVELCYDPVHPPAAGTLEAVDRWRAALEDAAAYWGTTPDAIRGWRIVASDSYFDCDGAAGHPGCAWQDAQEIWVSTQATGNWCPEWYLPHEFGHAALGLWDHTDPRFAALNAESVLSDICHRKTKPRRAVSLVAVRPATLTV